MAQNKKSAPGGSLGIAPDVSCGVLRHPTIAREVYHILLSFCNDRVNCEYTVGADTMKSVVVATVSVGYKEGLERIAQNYTRLHPEVSVKIQILPTNGYETWLRTQIPGGGASGPDIFNANFAWGLFEKGLLVNLSPHIAKNNPYTSKPWRETLSAPFLEKAKVGGEIAYIPLDFIEIAFYYNADIFKKLGLSLPRTWDELLATAAKIRAAGTIPFAVPGNADSYWSGTMGWIARFFSDAYLRHRLPEIMSRPGDWDYSAKTNAHVAMNLSTPFNDTLVTVNGERLLKAVTSKTLRFDDERFGELYTRLKEFSQHFQAGFHGANAQTAYHLFLTGHAAMLLDASTGIGQLLKDMEDLPPKARFNWGVFPIPPLTTSRFKIPAFRGVGGAGTVYAVVKKDPAQTALTLDFLQYLTTPASAKILVDEALSHRKPLTGPLLIPGTALPSNMQAHFKAFEGRGFEKLSFRGLVDEQQSVWEWTVWAQRYMEGRIPLPEFLQRYQQLMLAAVPRVVAMQHLDGNPATKDSKG